MRRCCLVIVVAALALCVGCAGLGYFLALPRFQSAAADQMAESVATSVAGRIAGSAGAADLRGHLGDPAAHHRPPAPQGLNPTAQESPMAKPTKVAEASDIEPGQGKVVHVDGKALAVFNCDGRFYAIDNTCVHRGGPLGEGELAGTVVTCPWHGWQWDVTTGANAMNPAMRVGCYRVTLEGGSLVVDL